MQKKLQKYVEELSLFEDTMDKYEYIIDLGKRNSDLDETEKNAQNKIQGCQSSVWIVAHNQDGKHFFKTDSDTVIVAGLAFILTDIFSGHEPEQILSFDRKALEKLGLDEIISPVRLNGFSSMLERIYAFARENQNG